MKNLVISVFSLIALSCSGPGKYSAETTELPETKLTEPELIARAYGIDNVAKLTQLSYTFNVLRDTTLFSRSWVWQKSTGDIIAINKNDTTRYNQNALTDDLTKVDHMFINDKYWLFFPFQLVWDTNITYTNKGLQPAPISGHKLTMLTIQYGDAGYTPGDAYDLYLDKDWLIREWVFRKSGQEDPSLATTWEGYTDINGIKVATNHLNKTGSFRLFFSDIHFE